uniref:Uncharacterized protein n=1 Tax=Parascaris univalens TaxID=6257 RepID=A0A915CG58_PARUN
MRRSVSEPQLRADQNDVIHEESLKLNHLNTRIHYSAFLHGNDAVVMTSLDRSYKFDTVEGPARAPANVSAQISRTNAVHIYAMHGSVHFIDFL